MRFLLTGATSQQANPEAHKRSANFMGLIWEQLRQDETYHVDWREPSVHWRGDDLLRDYDHVFVGMASPLAMGANRIYGAMSVLEQLAGSSRVTIVVDSPDPDLITRGMKSVLGNWDSFTKEFFSYRREFDLAREGRTNARLRMQLMRMLSKPWPNVLAPGFPWSDATTIALTLPVDAAGRVRTVNLDHLLLARYRDAGAPDRAWRLQEWAYEKSPDRKWLPSLNLGFPVRELKGNHRIATDPLHLAQLREATGLLVGPHRGEAWWTPKVAMSLSQLTPVFTDWTQSKLIGAEWAHLPGTHEVSRPEEADELAREQYVSYARSIPGPSEAKQALFKAAGVKPARARKAS